jgi:flagellar motor switch protein FliG
MDMSGLNYEKLKGPQKAAIFLLAMGQEYTASFFKRLDGKSIKEIGKYMSEITHVSSDVLDAVMAEFLVKFRNDTNLTISGRTFLEEVVSKSLDEQRAREIYETIGAQGAGVPFGDLTCIPPESVVNILKGEQPQTIALILCYLPQDKAGRILSLLPEHMKGEVALRIVEMGEVEDDLIKDIDQLIKSDVAKIGMATKKVDGIATLANILGEVDGSTEEYVLSQIEEGDGDLAEKIRRRMFVFEDLLQIDDRGFREILRNIESDVLVKALKTASEEMKQKILSNLSERAAEMLSEDMEVVGPVRVSEVEEAQQTIIKTAKRLEGEGKIVFGGKGRDEAFV